MTTDIAVTPHDVSALANALAANDLDVDGAVAAVPAELVAPYLAALESARINIAALTKGLTQRLVLDGQTGNTWNIEGQSWGLYGAQQKGYKDFPGLVRFLIEDCGMPVLAVAAATSDARVTDLRSSASEIADAEKRQAALDEIDAHRVNRGERGAPRFQLMEFAIPVKKSE